MKPPRGGAFLSINLTSSPASLILYLHLVSSSCIFILYLLHSLGNHHHTRRHQHTHHHTRRHQHTRHHHIHLESIFSLVSLISYLSPADVAMLIARIFITLIVITLIFITRIFITLIWSRPSPTRVQGQGSMSPRAQRCDMLQVTSVHLTRLPCCVLNEFVPCV